MNATFVDAGEAVSRPCPGPKRHLRTRPTLSLPGQALFPIGVR